MHDTGQSVVGIVVLSCEYVGRIVRTERVRVAAGHDMTC